MMQVIGVLGALAFLLYVLVVIVVGIQLYFKTRSWLRKLEGVLPHPDSGSAAGYTLLALALSTIIELGALYGFRNSPLLIAFAFPFIVGFTEEGSKLIPYFRRGGDILLRWRLSLRVALYFAIVEAVLYAIYLLLVGNILGIFLRIIVIMFHVSFTAIALCGALSGAWIGGYLKAAILHALYDAPVFVLLGIGGDLPVLFTVILSTSGVLYTYNFVDRAFMTPYTLAMERIEEKKREEEAEAGPTGGSFTSLP
ncbi:hypothetical protein [Thermococcus waiotapuensis]|uniref:Uncharacterized protein n=1 Tax=Thermococcus waiotapuensis TaxID=90909 RepID=A0AAE4NVG8_9EURY|nr:hypothetical protein [Thermococcus waiotapuensis]MDV3103395.1 hypothetical protein [Thermococcus waiotapuensis]